MPTETELKLRIHAQDADKVSQHPLLAAAEDRQLQHLQGIYYDTANQDLLKRKIGLRIRLERGRWIQTVKSAGDATGGLHQRKEWEVEVKGAHPESERLPREVKKLLAGEDNLLAQIRPLFETDFERETWQVKDEAGNHIEVCLDQGCIRSDTHSLPMYEVELELKSGHPSALFALALDLQADIPMVLENDSKAKRGYQLGQDIIPRPCKANELKLRKKMSAEEAFVEIIWNCLSQIQSNEAVVLRGEDSEGVHQMRVGLRRLRSALSLYKSLVPKLGYQEIQEEIRWLNGVLSPARDWDVFTDTLRQLQQHCRDHDLSSEALGIDSLITDAEARRQSLNAEVREALKSTRYSRLLLSLGQWLSARGWRHNLSVEALQALEQPVVRYARDMLSKQRKRMHKYGAQLSSLSHAERHAVRIHSKKLAYNLKFFKSLYPAHLCQSVIDVLSSLRNQLGALNDAAVARQLLEQIELSADAPAYGFLMGWYIAQDHYQLGNLDHTWSEFLDKKAFWKKHS